MSYEELTIEFGVFSTPISVHCTHPFPIDCGFIMQIFQKRSNGIKNTCIVLATGLGFSYVHCASGHKTQNSEL